MSTRCQIGYWNSRAEAHRGAPAVLIYQHSDGYPENMLPIIADFLREFVPLRGIEDDEYLMAQLLQHLIKDRLDALAPVWAEHGCDPVDRFLGFGLSMQQHTDNDYLYCISPEGVDVFDQTGSLLSPRDSKAMLKGVVPKRFR
ncbi:MAG: hypothetical protein WC551_08840 [Patescibacteria group bacterium]